MDFLECFKVNGCVRLGTDISYFDTIQDVHDSIVELRFLNRALRLLKLRAYSATVILGYLR